MEAIVVTGSGEQDLHDFFAVYAARGNHVAHDVTLVSIRQISLCCDDFLLIVAGMMANIDASFRTLVSWIVEPFLQLWRLLTWWAASIHWSHTNHRITFDPELFFLEQLVIAGCTFTMFFSFLLFFYTWFSGGRSVALAILSKVSSPEAATEVFKNLQSGPFEDEELLNWLLTSLFLLSVQCFNWGVTSAKSYFRIGRWLVTHNRINERGEAEIERRCYYGQIITGPNPAQLSQQAGFWWWITELVGYSSLGVHVITTVLLHLQLSSTYQFPSLVFAGKSTCLILFLALFSLEWAAANSVSPHSHFVNNPGILIGA